MPRALEDEEKDALQHSVSLIRFAAERGSLPEPAVAALNSALDSYKANQWDQHVATSFWMGFNNICSIIKPVTVTTLSTNVKSITRPRWQIWNQSNTSLSMRTASRYLKILIALLIISVALAFVVATANSLSLDIQKQIDAGDQEASKLSTLINKNSTTVSTNPFSELDAIKRKDIEEIEPTVQSLDYHVDTMFQKAQMLTRFGSFGFADFGFDSGSLEPVKDLEPDPKAN